MVKIQGQDLKFKCGYRKADLADGVGGAALEKIWGVLGHQETLLAPILSPPSC